MANGQIKGVGNAGNDRENHYQTVIKGWKLVLRWMVYLLQGSLLWVGKSGYDKKTHLEVHKNRLDRKIGPLSGLITSFG